jgi:hypothetical protein
MRIDTATVHAPPGSPPHRYLMKRFNERAEALRELFPDAKNNDDRRHRFAIEVLGDPARSSSKVWTAEEFSRIDAALDRLPIPEPSLW